MTDKQYWDEDSTLVKYYREAENLRTERFNQQAWLQGMYVYDAIIRIAPILQPFAKKGTTAEPYVDEAYPLGKKAVESAKAKKERETEQHGLRYMQSLMAQNNKHYQKE